MFELRYYYTLKDLNNNTRNFELVGSYNNFVLAMGIKKQKRLEPQYQNHLLKIVDI